jgi:hypothetical protein
METQSQRDILNRSGGLQFDAKHNQQYHAVVVHAPSQTPPCALPFAWAQLLNQSVDDPPVAGGFPFQTDPQAFTRVNGAGQITLNQHRILRLTAATARRSLAADGWDGLGRGRHGAGGVV